MSSEDIEIGLPTSTVVLRGPRGGACYVVGTAHVSRQSVEDVERVIRAIRPATIVLELCQSRIGLLHLPDDPAELKRLSSSDRAKLWQRDGTLALLLGSFSNKVGDDVSVVPGADLRAAWRLGRSLEPRARIVLGDRPIRITLQRVWTALSLWGKMRLVAHVLYVTLFEKVSAEDLEELRDGDAIAAAIEELSREFPPLRKPLITERDQFLAAAIRRASAETESGCVVAVVGAGHIAGIQEHWDSPIDTKELLSVPVTRSITVRRVVGVVSVLAGAYWALRYLRSR